ncbi:MAG: ribose-5-phosphate isomerase RpiA [Pseudomonadota bacterium]
MSDQDAAKRAAAEAALTHVKDGMRLGLGTGSTAAHFVRALGETAKAEGWELRCAPTSEATRALAVEVGLALLDFDETAQLDLTVDGADEADLSLNLLKGGGGALLREKIIAASSHRMIVIADETKCVAQLGGFPLPVEVSPFAWQLTVGKLRGLFREFELGDVPVRLRAKPGGGPQLSDGGAYLFDCALERIPDPAGLAAALNQIPGVIENGLFVGIADTLIVGGENGVRTVEAPAR